MEKSKVLLIDMYGVIIKESKGYFVPYTLQRFAATEHERIIRIIKDEQCFTKAQKGELSSEEFLSYLGYIFPAEKYDVMLRKKMYDLRSNDAFAYGKHFGRASPLPIL